MLIDRKKPSTPGALDRYEAFCPVCGMRITGSLPDYTEREYVRHMAWHEYKQTSAVLDGKQPTTYLTITGVM